MRAGRVVAVAAALLAGTIPATAHATPHFNVGTGQNPGVAVDAAGTAYIGWKVNVYAATGDAVQLCVLPAGARTCRSLATIPFPGAGYNLGRVSVLLNMVTSTDGGTLWSSEATIAVSPDALYTLELATAPNGHGVAVNGGDTDARPITVYVVDPRRANVARARFGDTLVQARTDLGDCVSERTARIRIQAARGGDLVSPGGVLRSARVSLSRSLVLHRSRWSTLVDLRGTRAKRTATVRLVPRHGRVRTLRYTVRGCGRVA